MRSTRLFHTTSFRLTLLYAGLTCVSMLLLFGVVFWSTANFMTGQIDDAVSSELADIRADAGGDDPRRLREVVRGLVGRAAGYDYLLQDDSGAVLAGNLPAMAPETGVREWRDPARDGSGAGPMVRGRGLRLGDGTYLFVGLDTRQLHEMKERVSRSFIWGMVAAMLLALAGGAAMSLRVLRRIETVSRASREIVAGDLRQRIPLRGSGDEFDHLAVSLNTMLDRIQTLMAGLQQVSTDIAHDLRTPLTRLRQRLELTRHRDDDAHALRGELDGALRDIDGILDTFAALLRIAQIESGTRKAAFAEVELGEVLRTVAEVYQPSVEEKGQVLRERIGDGLRVRGDRELLTQMFANLIENATRHAPAGAQVEIAARREAARVVAVVADDGPGIPEALRDKALQRFFRLEASRTTPGSGLGLSLVAAVAGLHEAELRLLDNRPGLRVELIFPATGAQKA